ncbi:hypothetical protein ACMZ5S_08295 [Streptococcus pluranimalium]
MATIISLLFAGLNLINGILTIMLIIALEARFWAIVIAFGSYFIIRESLYKFIHLMDITPNQIKSYLTALVVPSRYQPLSKTALTSLAYISNVLKNYIDTTFSANCFFT